MAKLDKLWKFFSKDKINQYKHQQPVWHDGSIYEKGVYFYYAMENHPTNFMVGSTPMVFITKERPGKLLGTLEATIRPLNETELILYGPF